MTPPKAKTENRNSKAAHPSSSKSRSTTKQAQLVALMRRSQGATIQEIATATGWQNHGVRGVISGALKKRLGLTITSKQEKRGRVYRVAAASQQARV
jgi:hypothetical protein